MIKDRNINTLKKNAMEAFEEFKAEMLSKSKEEIFKYAGTISAKNEIRDFLVSSEPERFDEDEIRKLESFGKGIIEVLYQTYLRWEYASVATFDDIREIVNKLLEDFKDEV